MKQNIIRLNGKLYDASTGKPVNNNTALAKTITKTTPITSSKITHSAKSRAAQTKKNSSNTISDFKRPAQPNARAKNLNTLQKSTKANSNTNQKKPTNLKSTTGIKSTHETSKRATSSLQRATTLKRSTVKNPIKTGVLSTTKNHKSSVSTKLQTNTASNRANKVNSSITNRTPAASTRSPLITKFNHKPSITQPKTTRLAQPKSSSISSVKAIKKPTSTTKINKATHRQSRPSLSTKELLIAKKFAELDAEKAIREQTKSKQKAKSNKYIKTPTILVSVIAIVLISVYAVYLSIPNIALKVASHRAGFTASLPHYLPAGFKFENPVQYKSGQIIMTFNSKSDGRSYALTQQPTQWDSESVFENYVKPQSNKPPYTIQNSGLTIYIYDNNSAAWVNGGKFFAINGKNAQLSIQQLQNIATSL